MLRAVEAQIQPARHNPRLRLRMVLYFGNHLLRKFRAFLVAASLFQFFLGHWRRIIFRLRGRNEIVNRIRRVFELPGFQRDIHYSARSHIHQHVGFNGCLALCGWRFDLLDDCVVRVRFVGFCKKVVAITQSYSSDGIRLRELDEDRKMRLGRNRIRIAQRYDSRVVGARRLYTSGLFHGRDRFRLREAGNAGSPNQQKNQGESSNLSHGCNTSSL